LALSSHRNLGIAFLVIGLLAGGVGSVFYPTATTTQCDNGNCVTTTPGLVNYLIAITTTVAFLLGLSLVYLAWRQRPRGYEYP
jgi:hypothetical protein